MASNEKLRVLMIVERYSHVMHIVSNVTGTLREGCDAFDAFAATFPQGTVSGAPKIRAMEIIRDLECAARGVYCGSLGVISPDGNMRFNVAIRTLTIFPDHELVCNVGSAIVADSTAREEYEECLIKARFLTGA